MANNQIATQRLLREQKKIEANPSDTFIALPNPQNIFEWHFLLYNFANDSPFRGGQFHGIINIPTDYPLKPPSIKFVTPNGRFGVGEKICLSFTNYHPETWSSSWTIQTMLIGLVSFMHTNERTVGGVDSNDFQKQLYAQRSVKHNLMNPQFIELFAQYYEKLGINNQNQNEIPKQTTPEQIDNQINLNLLPPPILQQDNNQRKKIIIGIVLLLFGIVLLLYIIFTLI